MKSRMNILIILLLQVFLLSATASPLFDADTSPSNIWVVNKDTGQVTGYKYMGGDVWTDSFLLNGNSIFPSLGANEELLVNSLWNSSQLLNPNLARISVADLGLGELNSDTPGALALSIYPDGGSFTETIQVELSISEERVAGGAASVSWYIAGANTGNSAGAITLDSNTPAVDGRLRTSFYLVKDDDYTVTVRLNINGNQFVEKVVEFSLASSDEGEKRDSDNDGIPDLVELAIGLDPLNDDLTTDSDGNGWNDFDQWIRELCVDRSGNITTDSCLDADNKPIDSDGDGWSDFDEILRGTEPKDTVTSLTKGASSLTPPEESTPTYLQTLNLFRDVPAASRLYEVEYLINVSSNLKNSNTVWQSYSSFSPETRIIFNSESLLTDEQLLWATPATAIVPQRRQQAQLNELITSNFITDLRLAASSSQMLDLLAKETTDKNEIKQWHSLYWLKRYSDLTPKEFSNNNDWTDVDDWKTKYIAYLQANLVQKPTSPIKDTNLPPSLIIDDATTTDAMLMLTMLTKEYKLSGAPDAPIFSSFNQSTLQPINRLSRSLAVRESGRTLDDVLLDIQTMSNDTNLLLPLREKLNITLDAMPGDQDSLDYLSKIIIPSVREVDESLINLSITEDEILRINYLTRLALFLKGTILIPDFSDLDQASPDSDGDSLSNQEEILSSIFSTATYPWSADSDSDGINDDTDACNLDIDNACILTVPTLTTNSEGGRFTVTASADGSYLIVTAQISHTYDQDVMIDYNLQSGTAIPGEDYEDISGTIVIPAGELTATIIINIPVLHGVDSTETFSLVFSNPVNVVLSQTSYEIDIITSTIFNQGLDSLTVSNGFLSPAFSNEQLNYSVTVNNDINVITVTPTLVDGLDAVQVNGVPQNSGEPSEVIVLAVGSNNITVYVDSENGSARKTYQVTVFRLATLSADANLSGLSLSVGSLSPAFDTNVLDYTSSVDFVTQSVTVTAILSDVNASVTINGVVTASGVASAPIGLLEGDNNITLIVLAEDGISTSTYTLIITRQVASNFAQQAYIKASNTGASDLFGSAVAVSNNTLAVGATGEDGSGAVYIFTRDSNLVWTQQAILKAVTAGNSDRFGSSLDLSGDRLVIGAPGEDSDGMDENNDLVRDSGAAYVFVRSGSTWSQQAFLKASNPDILDNFGTSVAISGNSVAVSATRESSLAVGIDGEQNDNSFTNAGAVYLFTGDASGLWTQQAYIKASNTGQNDSFGQSVELEGDLLVVGANGEGSAATGVNGGGGDNSAPFSGAVYVFERVNNLWSQQAYLKASNTDASDAFGRIISLSDGSLAVSANLEDSSAIGINGDEINNDNINSGAVYVFVRNGASVWSQQAYIKSSNSEASDTFGGGVSIFGDTLVVGAYSEDSGSVGVGGDQSDNSKLGSGAAYLFTRDANGDWTQQQYIKSSNSDPGDSFGRAIGLNNSILAISSLLEGSNATGINGNQGDNSLANAGAVYAYDLSAGSERLSNLTISNSQLSPSFDTLLNDYTASVSFGVNSITITPTSVDSSANISVNGTTVSSGATSNNIVLVEGDNLITIEVISTDGISTSSYTITVNRQSAALFAQSAYLKASNVDTTDQFGDSITISGNTMAVAATLEDGSSSGINGGDDNFSSLVGAVYVFVRDGLGVWTQQAYLKPSNTLNQYFFGKSLALDGDTLVVGANGETNSETGINGNQFLGGAEQSGAVYVFTRDASNVWSQQAYIKASNTDSFDRFGLELALFSDTLVVGAPFEDSGVTGINADQADNSAVDSGAIYVFTRTANVWTQQAYIKASNTDAGDLFGRSVDIYNDTIVVGATKEASASTGINGDQGNGNESGAVYVFTRDGSNIWSQQAYIKSSNSDLDDRFGTNVAILENTLAVSSPNEGSSAVGIDGDQNNNDAVLSGAVYIFSRDANNSWSQQSYLKASNTKEIYYFGTSLEFNDGLLAIGSGGEASASVGIDGDSSDSSAFNAGAVYLFSQDVSNNWSQQAYIKASNTELLDGFGFAIGISNGLLVISANQEDSGSGIDGDQSDNSISDSGAVYVFDL